MKSKPTPERVVKQLDKVIAVWEANPSFAMGPDVTLKKIKDTRGDLDGCVKSVKDLERQMTETTDQRDDCSRVGNQLVVRARKAILGFFGPDSTQYAQAGGTRSSERKTPVRKAKTTNFPKAA